MLDPNYQLACGGEWHVSDKQKLYCKWEAWECCFSVPGVKYSGTLIVLTCMCAKD